MSDPAARGEIERELAELEHELMHAVQRRDMEYLERSLGAEFTLTTGRRDAEIRSRQEWLDITRESYVIESFAFESLAVYAYGAVGVVRSRYRQEGRMGDRDRSGAYRMTDVWVRRDGHWQLVTRHISPLAAS